MILDRIGPQSHSPLLADVVLPAMAQAERALSDALARITIADMLRPAERRRAAAADLARQDQVTSDQVPLDINMSNPLPVMGHYIWFGFARCRSYPARAFWQLPR